MVVPALQTLKSLIVLQALEIMRSRDALALQTFKFLIALQALEITPSVNAQGLQA